MEQANPLLAEEPRPDNLLGGPVERPGTFVQLDVRHRCQGPPVEAVVTPTPLKDNIGGFRIEARQSFQQAKGIAPDAVVAVVDIASIKSNASHRLTAT